MNAAQTAVWPLLALLAVACNLPFLTERLFALGRLAQPKSLALRLLELAVGVALVVGLGVFWEARSGQIHPQGWAFYAVLVCVSLTLAFPGFAWRYLRRG